MTTRRKPNILWIFSDQHRAHALSCYGDENVQTPHLDRLAREGIRFTRAYSNTPLCAPFRATLYTGRYSTSHGVTSLHVPLRQGRTYDAVLPELLQQNGYHTSHMGKWHLAGGAAPCAFVSPYFRPGWNDWCGWENMNRPWATEYTKGDKPSPIKMEAYQTDGLTDLTVEWIRGRASSDMPWFHVVSIEPPHPPNTAPERCEEMFRDKPLALRPNVPAEHPRREKFIEDLRKYYAQIANLDDNVGRILESLEETGQLEDTIVFYFSDHGDLMGSHGMNGKSRPEQESSNIPLLIRYPALVPQGKVSDAYISGVDFMPTLLGMLGIDIPPGVEGADVSETVFGRKGEGTEDVLLQYEFTHFPPSDDKAFRTLLTEDWSYTCFLTKGPSQLYHLGEDPYELDNRINDPQYAAVRDRLHHKLTAKLAALNDDFMERMAAAAAK